MEDKTTRGQGVARWKGWRKRISERCSMSCARPSSAVRQKLFGYTVQRRQFHWLEVNPSFTEPKVAGSRCDRKRVSVILGKSQKWLLGAFYSHTSSFSARKTARNIRKDSRILYVCEETKKSCRFRSSPPGGVHCVGNLGLHVDRREGGERFSKVAPKAR